MSAQNSTTFRVGLVQMCTGRDVEKNIADASALIRQAAVRPKPRRPTKVPKAVKRQRLEAKRHRSGIKNLRRSKIYD